ncbi:MAG: alkaline phosphatase [Alistipes sp.]|nr:alkaline phosphatase [Alistipes sp.]
MIRTLSIIATFILTISVATAQEVKNIIYLIGDGMGLSSVSMMHIEGGYASTIFDEAENVALQKTYSADNRVTDSAASGTALATGYKTNNTFVGCTPDGVAVESLMDVAKAQGKATGVVVTTYLQHATPASFYAHTESRHNYGIITEQLVGSSLDVAIGGGMGPFKEVYKEQIADVIDSYGFNLVEEFAELEKQSGESRTLALLADWEVGANTGDYLADATREALRLLERRGEDNGFVLMVEGSLIDGMGHANNAQAQQLEMQGFMGAIEVAVEYAKAHEGTLVVVTADHETGGLSIVSADANFNLSEQGVEYRWSTNGHSGVMIPIYLYGTANECINGIVENTDIAKTLKGLIKGGSIN